MGKNGPSAGPTLVTSSPAMYTGRKMRPSLSRICTLHTPIRYSFQDWIFSIRGLGSRTGVHPGNFRTASLSRAAPSVLSTSIRRLLHPLGPRRQASVGERGRLRSKRELSQGCGSSGLGLTPIRVLRNAVARLHLLVPERACPSSEPSQGLLVP